MSIWTGKSRYGTYPADAKPVSKSTAFRWTKEHRIKTRRCQAIAKSSID